MEQDRCQVTNYLRVHTINNENSNRSVICHKRKTVSGFPLSKLRQSYLRIKLNSLNKDIVVLIKSKIGYNSNKTKLIGITSYL